MCSSDLYRHLIPKLRMNTAKPPSSHTPTRHECGKLYFHILVEHQFICVGNGDTGFSLPGRNLILGNNLDSCERRSYGGAFGYRPLYAKRIPNILSFVLFYSAFEKKFAKLTQAPGRASAYLSTRHNKLSRNFCVHLL